MLSHDNIAVDGETSVQRREHEARNTNHQQRRQEEAKNAAQIASGGPLLLACNLQQEFLVVDNQQVEQTPSANLAIATNELARLPPTPKVLKIQALLKAAQVQVNDIRNPVPSFSTMSARSRNPRGSHHGGGSRYHSGQIV